MPNGDTFVRITNSDVYKELQAVHTKIDSILTSQETCNQRFCAIETRLDRHSKKLIMLFVFVGPAALGTGMALI